MLSDYGNHTRDAMRIAPEICKMLNDRFSQVARAIQMAADSIKWSDKS